MGVKFEFGLQILGSDRGQKLPLLPAEKAAQALGKDCLLLTCLVLSCQH